ncbi:hypothetical protein G6F59_018397 [Rhizopus arrhizus]|nr:hypothetical protein G6F59_018397 [Rhizopus arrhizus]
MPSQESLHSAHIREIEQLAALPGSIPAGPGPGLRRLHRAGRPAARTSPTIRSADQHCPQRAGSSVQARGGPELCAAAGRPPGRHRGISG